MQKTASTLSIKRLCIHKSSKTLAFVLVVIAFPLFLIERLVTGIHDPMFFFGPFFFGAVSYLIFALVFSLYNFISRYTGGLSFVVDAVPVHSTEEQAS
jgi:hypothetical protein